MTTPPPLPKPGSHQYACPSCGAALEFQPGTAGLSCPYCKASLDITAPEAGSTKLDYMSYAALSHVPAVQLPACEVVCVNCGSSQQMSVVAGRCQSCKGPIVVTDDCGGELKAPDGIVPFVVTKAQAGEHFKKWATTRWFAPTALKKVVRTESMRGAYLPHWGFDDATTTDYTGQRGEHYYTTETYTENGQTRTRQVQHTAWYPASGRVSRDFVDVLSPGVTEPDHEMLEKLGPWSTANATGYQSEFLAGTDAPRYSVDAADGFGYAKQVMAGVIEDDCRQDIGGDEQRVGSMTTSDSDVLFRLLLLPLWLATYVFAGELFQVYVNANTGKVIGQRPYSWIKITAAVIVGLIVAGVVFYLYRNGHQS
ncbi:MAG: hypothetical protein JWO12_1236 [Frankiales bacterium]|nr:hypothetical protein [Frankiales bacterium]